MASTDLSAHVPARVRARGRRAYELARLRLGLRAALPVLPMAALSAALSGRDRWALWLGALLFATAVVLRARGQAYGRALVPGLVAGAAPLLLPLALRTSGHCCIGGVCWQLCMLGCIAGGFIAGASLGVVSSSEPENRNIFLLSATFVAGLAGMLGCTIAGASGIAGMAVAMLLTSLPISLLATRNRA